MWVADDEIISNAYIYTCIEFQILQERKTRRVCCVVSDYINEREITIVIKLYT